MYGSRIVVGTLLSPPVFRLSFPTRPRLHGAKRWQATQQISIKEREVSASPGRYGSTRSRRIETASRASRLYVSRCRQECQDRLVDGRERKAGAFILFLIFDLKITTWHLTRFLMDVGKPETIQKRGSSLGDEIGPPVSHWGPW
jgi:hypothetical protein